MRFFPDRCCSRGNWRHFMAAEGLRRMSGVSYQVAQRNAEFQASRNGPSRMRWNSVEPRLKPSAPFPAMLTELRDAAPYNLVGISRLFGGIYCLRFQDQSVIQLFVTFYLPNKQKLTSVAWVPRANYTIWATATCRRSWYLLLRMEGFMWSAWRIPWPYYRFSRPKPLLFLPSSSTIVLTRLSGPSPDSSLRRKSGSAGNKTRTSGCVAGTLTIRPQRLSSPVYFTI
jgi:hypothetical protein